MHSQLRHFMAVALAAAGFLTGPARAVDTAGRAACGTPGLLAAVRSGVADLQREGRRSSAEASLPRALTTSDGLFTLHYRIPALAGRLRTRRNAVPNAVFRVARTLALARLMLVERGGWPDPSPTRPLDVFLVSGPGSGRSRVVPGLDPALSPEEGVEVSILLAGPRASWAGQALHQYLHVLQLHQSANEDIWLYEASALALEAVLTGTAVPGGREAIASLERPHRSLLRPGASGLAGAALFLGYLADVHGNVVLREAWHQAGQRYGPNSLDALGIALRLTDLTTLDDAWRAFTVWLAYPDAASRPDLAGRLPDGIPPARPARRVTSLPDGDIGEGPLQVEPFGAAFIQLAELEDAGAVRFELQTAADAAVSADVLISWKHTPLGWMVVPVRLENGRGEITIPMEPGSRAVVVVRNHEPLSGTTVNVEFSASAEPTFPFDLAFLAADASPGRVDLSWGTDTESRMYGWIIYRATDPQGLFRPVTRLPLPSMGNSDGPLAYHFTDTTVVAGTRYYYLVEGVTVDGLARRSAAVAARAAPSR